MCQVGDFACPDINIGPCTASHDISWVPGTHVRFGDLDFIITAEGELAQAPVVVQTLHSTDLDAVMKMLKELQVSRREPFSLEYIIRSAPTVLPFGLCNTAETVGHLMAQRMIQSPTNNEFVGMIEHVT